VNNSNDAARVVIKSLVIIEVVLVSRSTRKSGLVRMVANVPAPFTIYLSTATGPCAVLNTSGRVNVFETT
jgi:hypothetical protein